jgi:hypothetical protein
MDPQQTVEVGEEAKRLHDELTGRFDLIRRNIHSKWESTTAHEADIREILYHKLHALNELERTFFVEMNAGKVAAKKLEAENVRSKHNR